MIERGETPGSPQSVNMLGLLNRHTAKSKIISVEECLQNPETRYNPRGSGFEAFQNAIEEAIGPQYSGNPAVISGTVLSGYHLDRQETAEDKLDSAKVVYDGVEIKLVDDVRRAVLKFHQRDYTRREDPGRVYYAFPYEGLKSFEVTPVIDTVRSVAKACRELTLRDEFLRQEPAERYEWIFRYNELLNRQMLPEDYRVVASAYLEVNQKQTAQGRTQTETRFIDGRGLSGADDTAVLTGQYTGANFGELMHDDQVTFADYSDFYIGSGAPCVVLQNTDRAVTYAIPPDAIQSIRITS